MSFKLSVPPGSAFWLPSWLGIGVAVESVGVAAVADDVAAAAAVLLLAGAAAVVAAAPVAPADPAVVVSRELLVTGAAGPSVVSRVFYRAYYPDFCIICGNKYSQI